MSVFRSDFFTFCSCNFGFSDILTGTTACGLGDMSVLLDSLNKELGLAFIILALLLLFLTVWVFTLSKKVRQFSGKWSDLLSGASGQNLERLLYDHLRQRMAHDESFLEIEKNIAELKIKMKTCPRFVGLVRFDAFPDVAGQQSFSLVTLNENGNGTVLTTLVGRNDSRVYCKAITDGKPDRQLTEEEGRAFSQARQGHEPEKFAFAKSTSA